MYTLRTISAGPPSYQSLFQRISLQLSDAHSQRDRSGCGRIVLVLIGILILLFLILVISLIFGLPLGMITIGSIHLKDCPAHPYIPIFLIVAGNEYILNKGQHYFY